MIELVFESCVRCKHLDANIVFILGPFMDEPKRQEIHKRAESYPQFTVIDYHARIESLIEGAQGMITMGGYNTFCEILSFDKPAIVIPRFEPRTEQLIRARRAKELGLVEMLEPEQFSIESLVPLLENLSSQACPSAALLPGMLDGMDNVCKRVVHLLSNRSTSD